MRNRTAWVGVLALVVALAAYASATPDEDAKGPAFGEAQAGATYIGEKKCKKCHIKQHKAWKDMKHSAAWETLPEAHRNLEAKDEHGRLCVSCHTTGYGHVEQAGFKDAASSEHLLGVQCESCHGPGSKHEEAAKALKKEKGKEFGPGQESYISPSLDNCSGCHNPHVSHAEYAAK